MLSDIEIAQKSKMKPIGEIAAKLGIPDSAIEPLRPHEGQDLARLRRLAREEAGRQAHPRHRHQPHARGRGQDHDHRRPGRRAQPHRQEGGDLPARALAGPRVRHEGRGGRRRLRPGGAHGGHQPALHGRLQRHRARQQPAGRDDRQPHQPRQRAGLRRAPHRVEARDGHERPGAARDHRLPGRAGQRLPARGRLRHRRGLRGDGDLLPRHVREGPEGAPGQHRLRLHPRPEAHPRPRPQDPRRDGGAAQGRAGAQPRADPRAHARPSSTAARSPTSRTAATRCSPRRRRSSSPTTW